MKETFVNNFNCFLGIHKYEIYQEAPINILSTDIEVGKAIISRCKHCGKIKVTKVELISNPTIYE